jgi:hypothetical protein
MSRGSYLTIRAKEVRVGDRIYNKHGYDRACGLTWVRVTEVLRVDPHVVLRTPIYDDWRHPDEAIAVQREEEHVELHQEEEDQS